MRISTLFYVALKYREEKRNCQRMIFFHAEIVLQRKADDRNGRAYRSDVLVLFVRKGKGEKKFPRKIAGINDKQPFDFEEDADLIYAGFMQQYGIDLQESSMHWWKFMILLENLGNGTRLQKGDGVPDDRHRE